MIKRIVLHQVDPIFTHLLSPITIRSVIFAYPLPRPALLSEPADDQPSHLATPSLFLTDILTHLCLAFLSFVYGSSFVGLTCQSHN
jgi:hypothetical protein